MESKEIIKSIDEIYKKYRIPPWLQSHMKRSGASVAMICDNWKGPVINKEDIIARNLIHDLGNIIKMDLDSDFSDKLAKISGDKKGIGYWKKVQAEMIKKYGNDELNATENMSEEFANRRIRFLIKNSIFMKNDKTFLSRDWNRKICAYSDQRIGPFGIMALSERYEEHRKRNSGKKDYESKQREICFAAGLKIEKQILKYLKISPEEMTEEAIKKFML